MKNIRKSKIWFLGAWLALNVVGCGARPGLGIPARDGGVAVMDGHVNDVDSDVTGCLFVDEFEGGTQAWALGGRWSALEYVPGRFGIMGWWENWDVGCPVTSSAKMAVDVDLRVSSAELVFRHYGEACPNDTLRIIVSTDHGNTWTPASVLHSPPDTLQLVDFATVTLSLAPWIGQSAVRFGFEFDNVCGDPCGVQWVIDDVSICPLGH